MKIFVIILCYVSIAINSAAQSFEWIRGRDLNYSMNPDLLNYSLSLASDGSFWHGGLKSFKEFQYEAMGDLFVTHFSSNGMVLADFEISGTALLKGLEADPNGGLYIIGEMQSDLVFPNGYTLVHAGSNLNGFIARLSSAGSVDWAINLSLLFPGAVPEDLFIYKGNVYLAHSEWSESNITEFDNAGNILRNISQPNVPLASGLGLDGDGNIIVTGSCSEISGVFGGIGFPTSLPYSMYLAKYDSSGIPQWVRFVEDITCVKPKVKIDMLGRIVWAGPLHISTLFDTITLNGPLWGTDFFLTVFNGDGRILWGLEVPPVQSAFAGFSGKVPLTIMPDNSISIAGFTRGTIDWGNGVVTIGNGLDYQVLVLNVSEDGIVNWGKTGGGSGYDVPMSIDVDDNGNLFFAGVGHGALMFDTCSYTGNSYYFPFLAKISSGINTGISRNLPTGRIKVYPNPAQSYLVIESSDPEQSVLILSDMQGKEILRYSPHNYPARIDLGKLPSGPYLIRRIGHQSIEIEKIIVL